MKHVRRHGLWTGLACALGAGGALAQSGDAARLELGKRVFEANCKVCHDTGKKDNDAPQLSHAQDWKERARDGRERLYRGALEGVSGYFEMPPRGGNPGLSDEEAKAAVDYILERAGVR